MVKDDRDILEVLREELDFVEKGGYGRSVRTPQVAKRIFQDSLSCLNYGYPYRAHPCNECLLIEMVPDESRSEAVPCHHIPLNGSGMTIEELEASGNEAKLAETVKAWLKKRISDIEAERAKQAADS